jgi:hypothetical protein
VNMSRFSRGWTLLAVMLATGYGRPAGADETPVPLATSTPSPGGAQHEPRVKGKKTPGAPRASKEPLGKRLKPGDFALPAAAPRYDNKGRYLPTIYIYQETNGEFRILGQPEAKASPPVSAPGGAPAQQALPPGGGAPPAPAAQKETSATPSDGAGSAGNSSAGTSGGNQSGDAGGTP